MHDIYVMVGRLSSGFDNRPLNEAETKQFELVDKLPIEKVHELVSNSEKHLASDLGEDFDDIEVEIFVRPFQNEDPSYRISLDEMNRSPEETDQSELPQLSKSDTQHILEVVTKI
ncbi:hypothetical protein K3495_g6522 [Podosphaera aphanis]|nr:hypothetical protein K3495_g6522 [Podosphaera aphanis]